MGREVKLLSFTFQNKKNYFLLLLKIKIKIKNMDEDKLL